jgi:hypothetical protein
MRARDSANFNPKVAPKARGSLAGTDASRENKVCNPRNNVMICILMLFCLLLEAASAETTIQPPLTDDTVAAIQLIKEASSLAGFLIGCDELKIASDATNVRDSILDAIGKNNFLDSMEIEYLIALSADTFSDALNRVSEEVLLDMAFCERPVRDFLSLKVRMSLSPPSIRHRAALICAPCANTDCSATEELDLSSIQSFNYRVLFLTHDYYGKDGRGRRPSEDKLRVTIILPRWTTRNTYYFSMANQISVAPYPEFSINRFTLRAKEERNETEFLCSIEDYDSAWQTWMVRHRSNVLHERQF